MTDGVPAVEESEGGKGEKKGERDRDDRLG